MSPVAPLLTVSQVAERLRVSTALVRRLAASGRLPARKVGAYWLIAEKDLERFLQQPRPPGRPSSVSRCEMCGRTYPEHRRDKPKHVFVGSVWLVDKPRA